MAKQIVAGDQGAERSAELLTPAKKAKLDKFVDILSGAEDKRMMASETKPTRGATRIRSGKRGILSRTKDIYSGPSKIKRQQYEDDGVGA